MNLLRILSELKKELQRIELVIEALGRLADTPRRHAPPAKVATKTTSRVTKVINRKGSVDKKP